MFDAYKSTVKKTINTLGSLSKVTKDLPGIKVVNSTCKDTAKRKMLADIQPIFFRKEINN